MRNPRIAKRAPPRPFPSLWQKPTNLTGAPRTTPTRWAHAHLPSRPHPLPYQSPLPSSSPRRSAPPCSALPGPPERGGSGRGAPPPPGRAGAESERGLAAVSRSCVTGSPRLASALCRQRNGTANVYRSEAPLQFQKIFLRRQKFKVAAALRAYLKQHVL